MSPLTGGGSDIAGDGASAVDATASASIGRSRATATLSTTRGRGRNAVRGHQRTVVTARIPGCRRTDTSGGPEGFGTGGMVAARGGGRQSGLVVRLFISY